MRFNSNSSQRNSTANPKAKPKSKQRSKKQTLQTFSLSLIFLITFALVGSSLHTHAQSSAVANSSNDGELLSSEDSSNNTQADEGETESRQTQMASALSSRAMTAPPARLNDPAPEKPESIPVSAQVAVAEYDTDSLHNSSDTSDLSRDETEILWLARILYSETLRASEQYLVGWVVRNRVETGFWNGHSYEEIATQPDQFSGLQPWHPKYHHNISRKYGSTEANWKQALSIAREVYYAPESRRPFTQMTRHFYSPYAVKKHPEWAVGQQAIHTVEDEVGNVRFAFYSYIR